jgi:hypothetical protein
MRRAGSASADPIRVIINKARRAPQGCSPLSFFEASSASFSGACGQRATYSDPLLGISKKYCHFYFRPECLLYNRRRSVEGQNQLLWEVLNASGEDLVVQGINS